MMENTSGPRPITDREFQRFQQLIYSQAGIYLSPVKKALLMGRLSRRLRDLAITRFDAYYEQVLKDESGAEMVFLLDAITTNETHFFREPHQFDYLMHRLCPLWERAAQEGRRTRHLRIWSAACSTGEEPYSLAMALLDRFPAESGWRVDILATDISTRALDKARLGIWDMSRAHPIPAKLLKRFMLRGTGSQEGRMKAGVEIRDCLSFRRLNLNDAHYQVDGPFDAIFCRNVLIYFDQESRMGVIDRLLDLLAPGGHFFLGHAESLTGMTNRVRSMAPAVYCNIADNDPGVANLRNRTSRL